MAQASWWCILAVLVVSATAKQNFSLPEFLSGNFTQRGFTGRWISDDEFTYTLPGDKAVYKYNVSSLATGDMLAPADVMEELNATNPILSPDGKFLLVQVDEEIRVYRHSRLAKYTLWNIDDRRPSAIAEGKYLQLCIFSGPESNNHAVAYVLDNDLYYQPSSTSEPIRITTDGNAEYYNGHADWVYEEDVMGTGQATWLSTAGTNLAFATYDDTKVESYSWYRYSEEDLYPELFALKYPKVGHKNPTVLLRVVNLKNLEATGIPTFTIMDPPESVTEDHILGGVTWITDTEIAAHWLNRRQNYTVLRICNVETHAPCEEEHRQQPNGWVPIALPRFSSKGDFYVSTRWSMEQADGNIWQHLYVSLRVGGEIISTSITPGAITVNSFVGMDEERFLFYYTRTVEGKPWQTEVHRAGAGAGCLSCHLRLPGGGPCSWATATASARASFLTITCQSPEEPSATFLINPRLPLEQMELEVLESNMVVRDLLRDKANWTSIITTVPLENNFPAPVRLLLPPGLNVSDSTVKYPVIFYVYSGPNTQTVLNTFTVGYHAYLTTSRNVIYMMADGRGSGLKGQDILYSINNKLGTVEVEDHFVILRQVLDRYPFMDRNRVGIWGHSYGGYATLLTLIKDEERMFQCGISTAPVTSWLYYNTMYTERYMGLPTEDDNLKGYQDGDVTLLAEKLRGHDLLLMHGNADDNVHFQNAAKLMTALQKLDIPFEQMSYPNENHNLGGEVALHRYDVMDRFLDALSQAGRLKLNVLSYLIIFYLFFTIYLFKASTRVVVNSQQN